jgi:dihydrofolate reductase
MSMSLDGYVASDREHPGTAVPEDAELVRWKLDVRVHGGASFAAALAARGLMDEYCLVIQPTAIGGGQSLFGALPVPLRLDLIEARSFDCGVVHVYRAQPARTARAAG